MLTRRHATFAFLAASAIALAVPARAEDNAPQPYTEAAFDAAQKAGRPILVDTYATWCDICARQKRSSTSCSANRNSKSMVTFRVDFDTQKDVMRKFNARLQSTLIVFHGDREIARTTGETQPSGSTI